ncbi:MAG: pilus (MSHA type) biogenesis protein MshL [Desulfocapsaceae bacterium]|nr:pilus (MSHA type) biogenesis protein MshL [Desulfocapsaceae bacterium]
MKLRSKVASALALFLLSLVLLSCSPLTAEPEKPTAEAAKVTMPDATPPSLPVQYMKPSYRVDAASKNELDSQADDVVLKVGAKISSNKKVPLREIMKPLASQKKFNISWASDVDQDILVDVDIKADDDFYKAIENLLRQVEYFYEVQGSTIVIKYRESRQFQIAMPYTKQTFTTGTGGNALGASTGGVSGDQAGNNDSSSSSINNIEGTIKITSTNNEFDVWGNIQYNLENILDLDHPDKPKKANEPAKDIAKSTIVSRDREGKVSGTTSRTATYESQSAPNNENESIPTSTLELNHKPLDNFIIDRHIGLITVTATRPLLAKIDAYFTSLKKEIYKQVSIEAKIIEVQLLDSSSIGINWNSVLKNFDISGAVEFGAQTITKTIVDPLTGIASVIPIQGLNQVGQVFPYVFANENANGTWNDGTNHGSTYDPTRLVSNVRINTANFDVFLNALKTQGNTKILSNPKISVLNGQPAMISVGRNVTYLKEVKSTTDANTGNVNYTVTPATILSGVGLGLTATILDNNEIIMNLVPVTSELIEGTERAVIVAGQGETAVTMGLPVVNIREMSTTVRVKDGEMLVIGGLISDMNQDEGNFAPVLGDIPLLKYLFGYETKVKNKRELIILLKPRII